jgi:ribosomal protein S18 acetylase RimI-like enzyme
VTLPPGFRLRPARDEDAAAAAALSREESLALVGFPSFSEERLLRFWTAPSVDREHDVAVVEAPDGRLAACRFVTAEPPFVSVFAIGFVGLPFHGQGIGATLVAENERRALRFVELAPSGRRVVIHAGAFAGEPRSRELFGACGYREVRQFQLMRIEFEGPPPVAEHLPGIALRRFDTGDERPVHETHLAAFADHWGEETPTYEDFNHHLFAAPDFDPGLWVLAWEGPSLAGYVGAVPESDERSSFGHVTLLGVRPEYRRRGIGEALLRSAFCALYERGKAGCDLHVDADSLTGATRLYERVGMTAYPRFTTWEKELRPGSQR